MISISSNEQLLGVVLLLSCIAAIFLCLCAEIPKVRAMCSFATKAAETLTSKIAGNSYQTRWMGGYFLGLDWFGLAQVQKHISDTILRGSQCIFLYFKAMRLHPAVLLFGTTPTCQTKIDDRHFLDSAQQFYVYKLSGVMRNGSH